MTAVLFKFCSGDSAVRILKGNSVFVSSPLDLNDPFEMRPGWTDEHERRFYADQQLRSKLTACGFACPKCLQEIETTLKSKDGVSKVYMGEGPEEGKVIAEHDPAVATVDQLIEAFKTLPTFYEGFFIPAVITS